MKETGKQDFNYANTVKEDDHLENGKQRLLWQNRNQS